MMMEDFIAKLASVGLVIVANATGDDGVAEPVALDADQRDELQTIIDDLGADAVNAELHSIDTIELPSPDLIESLDAIEWAKAFNPEGYERIPCDRKHMAAWFGAALAKGADANRVRGLNADDEDAAFDVPEVNAVEFVLNDDEGGKVWLNVDGRCRARFGRTTTVIVEDRGNRTVLRNAVNGG